MVRNIVGSLVYVGIGRQPADWIGTVLAGRDRGLAAPTFSPEGLYLQAVTYDGRFGLPAPPPGSRRFLAPADALALRRRVPSWVAVVGLFVDPAEELLARTVARVGLD